MPEYLFQQKINTIARVWEPFDHNGFHFEAHYDSSMSGTPDGWIASKSVTANDCDAASQEFFSELGPLVDKISFVTQCFAVTTFEPWLFRRVDRPEFYLLHSNKRGHVPLQFGANELESLAALEHYDQKGDAFRYLREAINATDFYARLAMLASALEGIAGEKTEGQTDREYIKCEILGDRELYERMFKHTVGIRNQLLHGKKIDLEAHGETPYVQIIYDKIVSYFNKKHQTKINTEAKNAPRTIGLNYNLWRGWLSPVSGGIKIDLKWFCERDLHEATKDFETVSRPRAY